jgi:thiol-disulfide isomerase/thioredoxin
MSLFRLAGMAWVCFISAPAWAGGPVDFELPEVSGQRFFRAAEVGPAIMVVNVWDTDCPPCLREWPLLNEAAARHPQVRFVGISVSSKPATRDFLARHPSRLVQLFAPAEPRGLLRQLGNPSGALPHTVVLNARRHRCAQHTGEVSGAWLDEAIRRCG